MGAADVIPGVSGGTIAFITGIYQRLIVGIKNVDFKLLKTLKTQGFKHTWKQADASFLLTLFLGIATSIITLSKGITYLLKEHPILLWAYFFGLIIASSLIIAKQIKQWNKVNIIGLLSAVILSYFITIANPSEANDSNIYLFFSGFIAIIAMILPGISGSFILLLLGSYRTIMDILSSFIDAVRSFDTSLILSLGSQISVFVIGLILGLVVFSRVLTWLFERYQNLILSILTGFMIGSLNKVWPWKKVISFRTNHQGEEIPFIEKSILPSSYEGDNLLIWAVIASIIGFGTIFMLNIFDKKKNNGK